MMFTCHSGEANIRLGILSGMVLDVFLEERRPHRRDFNYKNGNGSIRLLEKGVVDAVLMRI